MPMARPSTLARPTSSWPGLWPARLKLKFWKPSAASCWVVPGRAEPGRFGSDRARSSQADQAGELVHIKNTQARNASMLARVTKRGCSGSNCLASQHSMSRLASEFEHALFSDTGAIQINTPYWHPRPSCAEASPLIRQSTDPPSHPRTAHAQRAARHALAQT